MIELVCGRGYAVDWNAVGAVSTLFAAFVALMLPFLMPWLDERRKAKVIQARMIVMVDNLFTDIHPIALMVKSMEGCNNIASAMNIAARIVIVPPADLDHVSREAHVLPSELAEMVLDLYQFTNVLKIGCEVTRDLYSSMERTRVLFEGKHDFHNHRAHCRRLLQAAVGCMEKCEDLRFALGQIGYNGVEPESRVRIGMKLQCEAKV